MSTSERDNVTCPNCGRVVVPARYDMGQSFSSGGCPECGTCGPSDTEPVTAMFLFCEFCDRMAAVKRERDALAAAVYRNATQAYGMGHELAVGATKLAAACWLKRDHEAERQRIADAVFPLNISPLREAGGTIEGFNAKGEGTP